MSISSLNASAGLSLLSSYSSSSSSSAASSLLSSSSSSSSSSLPSIINLDLSSAYSSTSSTSSSSTSSSTSSTKKDVTKVTPWDSTAPKISTEKLYSKAMSDTSVFSSNLTTKAGTGITDKNDKEIFSLYNAVNAVKALADTATSDKLTTTERAKIQARIKKGIDEINTQAKSVGLDGATLIAGNKYSTAQTKTLGSYAKDTYTTDVLATGDSSTVPDQFKGDVKFTVSAKTSFDTKSVTIDLSGMGTTERTVGNVAAYINSQLDSAGINSRFSRLETTKTVSTGTDSSTSSTSSSSKSSTTKTVTQQSLKISYGSDEVLSFSPVTDDTNTAIYVGGAATTTVTKDSSGKVITSDSTSLIKAGNTTTNTTNSVLTKLELSSSDVATKVDSSDLSSTDGAKIRSMATDSDGNVYVIADASGTFNGTEAKDTTDVVLQKYDSTGKVLWSRALGSEATASGYSIAVSSTGTIAIAGSVDGKGDAQTSTTGDGIDSFVATFDSDGKDLWYYQKGATGTDTANSVAFDSSGNLLVLGQTKNAIGGVATNGGTDVYVQSFSSTGTVNYTKTIGTSGTDSPIGLSVVGNQALVAWNSDTEGHISRLNSSDGSFASSDYLTTSNNVQKLSAFGVDENGTAVMAGSSVGGTGVADQLKGVNLLTGNTVFSDNLSGNPVRSLNVQGSMVSVALEGTTSELATSSTALQTLVNGYSTTDGSQLYSMNVLGEANKNVSIVAVSNQSNSLDALGLPQGKLTTGDTTRSLTDLTSLRAGDYFYVANNSSSKVKITISQGETMDTLKTKLNTTLGSNATASVVTNSSGGKYLTVTPKGSNKIEFSSGTANADALSQLGIDAGVVMTTAKTTTSSGKVKDTKYYISNSVVEMELPASADIDISDKTKAQTLSDKLSSVLTNLRVGYRNISKDTDAVAARKQAALKAKTSSSSSSSSAAAVTMYNKQTSAYQAALAKLGG